MEFKMHITDRRSFNINSIALLSSLLASPAFAKGGQLSDALLKDIDNGIMDAITNGASPSVQISIFKQGQPIYKKAIGLSNLENKIALTQNDVFRAGSLTKQFTAAAILLLAQKKKLDLSDNASKYLPEFSKLAPFSISELLWHTAGIHSDETDTSILGKPRSHIVLAKEIATQKQVFDFPSGTSWLYSNANYIILGAIIEKIMGISYDKAINILIIKPLKLNNTYVENGHSKNKNLVTGYTPLESETPKFEKAQAIEYAEAGAAGALISNTDDLCKWHQALLFGNLLNKESRNKMINAGLLRDGRISGANRFSEQDANYGDVQYGMGLLIDKNSNPEELIFHYGFISGFSSYLASFVKSKITIAILCNADNNPAMPFRAVRKAISKSL